MPLEAARRAAPAEISHNMRWIATLVDRGLDTHARIRHGKGPGRP